MSNLAMLTPASSLRTRAPQQIRVKLLSSHSDSICRHSIRPHSTVSSISCVPTASQPRPSPIHFAVSPHNQLRGNGLQTQTTRNFSSDVHSANIHAQSSTPDAAPTKLPGLFGIKGLYKPEDFTTLVAEKEKEVMLRIDLLSSNPVSEMTLQWVDDISKLLCDITDVAEFCRNIHADEQWCEAAHDAWMKGQELMASLSLNPVVSQSLVALAEDADLWARTSGEGRRVALDLLARMNTKAMDEVVDAFHVDLSQDAHQVETDFATNTDNFTFVPLGTSRIPKDLSQFRGSGYCREERGQAYILNHPSILSQALMLSTDSAVRRTLFDSYQSAYTHRGPLLSSMLHRRYALACLGGGLSHAHTVAVSLLSKDPTFTTAQLLQCARGLEGSLRAEYGLLRRMQEKPLQNCDSGPSSILGRFFAGAAAQDNANTGAGVDGKSPRGVEGLHASDVQFLVNNAMLALSPASCGALSTSSTSTSSSTGDVAGNGGVKTSAGTDNLDVTRLFEYFPLHAVLDGMDVLFRSLLGVHLRVEGVTLAEDWTLTQKAKDEYLQRFTAALEKEGKPPIDASLLPSPSHQLVKLALVDTEADTTRGYVYLDLFERSGKNISDAQFVLQCGRVNHDDAMAPPVNVEEAELVAGGIDPAVCAIVLQVPTLRGRDMCPADVFLSRLSDNPESSHNPGKTTSSQKYLLVDDKLDDFVSRTLKAVPTHLHSVLHPIFTPHVDKKHRFPLCLQPESVKTIAHELGHAAHTILSRTQYQHFSGSRCEMDFVETPSTLFELFAGDEAFLSTFARHYRTQEPLPEAARVLIAGKRKVFSALNANKVVLRALLDMRLHGIPVGYDAGKVFPYLGTDTDTSTSDGNLHILPEYSHFFAEAAAKEGGVAHAAAIRAAIEDPHSILNDETIFPLNEENVNAVVRQFYREFALLDIGESHRPHLDNTHLAHYSGVYYTYVFCAAFATLLKEVCLKSSTGQWADPIKGRRYRDVLLGVGGKRNGLDILADLLELEGQERDFTPQPDNDIVGESVKGAGGVVDQNNDGKSSPEWYERSEHILKRLGWRDMALTERQMKVVNLALETYVKQINEDSRDGIAILEKALKL